MKKKSKYYTVQFLLFLLASQATYSQDELYTVFVYRGVHPEKQSVLKKTTRIHSTERQNTNSLEKIVLVADEDLLIQREKLLLIKTAEENSLVIGDGGIHSRSVEKTDYQLREEEQLIRITPVSNSDKLRLTYQLSLSPDSIEREASNKSLAFSQTLVGKNISGSKLIEADTWVNLYHRDKSTGNINSSIRVHSTKKSLSDNRGLWIKVTAEDSP